RGAQVGGRDDVRGAPDRRFVAVVGTPGKEVVVWGRGRLVEGLGHEGEGREREKGGSRRQPRTQVGEHAVQRLHVLSARCLDVNRRTRAGERRRWHAIPAEETGIVRQRGGERQGARA